MKREKVNNGFGYNLLTVIGIILCVILIPILIINITLIVKSCVKPDTVPNAGGFLPLIVLTDSMYPNIKSGDLIICHTADPESIEPGDVISFFDPEGNGTSIVTHRVVEITSDNGELAYKTKGDANNTGDASPVPASKLVGVYKTRLAGAGNIAMFMQTTPGLLICVLLPLLLLVGYDTIRRRKYNSKHKADTDALMAELEALKAAQAQKEEVVNQ